MSSSCHRFCSSTFFALFSFAWTSALLESTLAPYLLQTNLLNTLKYTDEQRQIVIGHQDNYNAYRQALVQAKVKRAKKVEEQERWQEELILEAIWVVQVNRVFNLSKLCSIVCSQCCGILQQLRISILISINY
jgi:hypothetical protein